MIDPEVQRIIEAVFAVESPRLVAMLLRRTRDLGLAEQLAQDAFVAALEQWPRDGVPAAPGAWLTTAARRGAVDARRRGHVRDAHVATVAAASAAPGLVNDPAATAAVEVQDDMLRLMLLCCHPVLPLESRAALTLRLVAGLPTAAIARAYLQSEATIAQRLVRGKQLLAEHQVALDLPGAADRERRGEAVAEVVYLLFNEGHAGSSGSEWLRIDLAEEALRLARMLAAMLPHAAEVHGLVALLELQAARFPARVDAEGAPVLLRDQDRARWDRTLVQRGLAALTRAEAIGGEPGQYRLQAAIAACHARAPHAALTDWPRIVHLYGELLRAQPSPVVALNRAVAVAMVFGPAAGLRLVDELATEPSLAGYHLLPSVRGDLLWQLGRRVEAKGEFFHAASLAGNERERELLQRRVAACD